SRDPTYKIYVAMLDRCYKPHHHAYARYGGRGIDVSERWRQSFFNFLEDMGNQPPGLTLERKNNDLGYSKENCRWASRIEQAHNRSNSITVTIDGISKNLAEWCRLLKIDEGTV